MDMTFAVTQYKPDFIVSSAEEGHNVTLKYTDQNFENKTTPEPQHDKVAVHPAKTQISLGIHPVWSVFAVRLMGS